MSVHRAPGFVLLGIASVLQLWWPSDREAGVARRWLGPAERVALDGGSAYRSGERVLLFFERPGMQGRIRGAVLLDGGLIERVLLLDAMEGVHRDDLQAASFGSRFRGAPADPPVTVDAVSGATVSSQAVIDAVNERLGAWRARAAP